MWVKMEGLLSKFSALNFHKVADVSHVSWTEIQSTVDDTRKKRSYTACQAHLHIVPFVEYTRLPEQSCTETPVYV